MLDIHPKDMFLIYVVTKEYQINYYGLKIKICRLIEGINLFFMLISIFILYGYLDITFSYIIGSIWTFILL